MAIKRQSSGIRIIKNDKPVINDDILIVHGKEYKLPMQLCAAMNKITFYIKIRDENGEPIPKKNIVTGLPMVANGRQLYEEEIITIESDNISSNPKKIRTNINIDKNSDPYLAEAIIDKFNNPGDPIVDEDEFLRQRDIRVYNAKQEQKSVIDEYKLREAELLKKLAEAEKKISNKDKKA